MLPLSHGHHGRQCALSDGLLREGYIHAPKKCEPDCRGGVALTLMAIGSTPCYNADYAEEQLVDRYRHIEWSHIPQWSSTGEQIIIEYNKALYNIAVSDGAIRRLSVRTSDTLSDFDKSPTVSPDGTRMAYSTLRFRTGGEHNFEIVTASLDGRDIRKLTNHEFDDISPIWSPDGTRIAFLSEQTYFHDDYKLYTVAADGSDVHSVTPEILTTRFPISWAPDGKKLPLIGSQQNSSTGGRVSSSYFLFTVSTDGSNLIPIHKVTDSAVSEHNAPAWSPDGVRIAFTAFVMEEWGLYVADADGGNVTKLVDGEISDVLWFPNGDEILYKLDGTLWAIPADGSLGSRQISSEPVRGAYLSWSPDGDRIAAYYSGYNVYLQVISLDGSTTGNLLGNLFP